MCVYELHTYIYSAVTHYHNITYICMNYIYMCVYELYTYIPCSYTLL